jgi:hypothetical protein
MTSTMRLKIGHASLQFDDTDAEADHDLRLITQLDIDILCGTESGDKARRKIVRKRLELAGYKVYIPDDDCDSWIAVRKDLIGDGWGASYIQVHGTGKEMHDPHHYASKGVVKVEFDHRKLGHVGIVTSHYLRFSGKAGAAQHDKPGDPVDHRAWSRKLANALTGSLLREAEGKGIGFFTADTNMLDENKDVVFGAPLTTCWDELGKHPNTGHGNIDVIASVDKDKRVTCHDAYVLNDRELFLYSDHFLVIAVYDVHTLAR